MPWEVCLLQAVFWRQHNRSMKLNKKCTSCDSSHNASGLSLHSLPKSICQLCRAIKWCLPLIKKQTTAISSSFLNWYFVLQNENPMCQRYAPFSPAVTDRAGRRGGYEPKKWKTGKRNCVGRLQTPSIRRVSIEPRVCFRFIDSVVLTIEKTENVYANVYGLRGESRGLLPVGGSVWLARSGRQAGGTLGVRM